MAGENASSAELERQDPVECAFCHERARQRRKSMIVLGIVLIVLGLVVATLHILVTIGIVLLAVGLVLAVLGGTGRAIAGRSHWW
ncbi:DUF6131 family protein [Cellulomonas sp. P24]|uniref:DUF6131 family protein n=1 Tax=Cellulomonas sp. P24 TaxID=2885206 RepID=UPI00216B5CFE|nr:DUF6131 family protein [Cellulomonas sp. P24]MCR6491045.1 DUF6131 family protein [Cellulomonas sp. P24]